LTVLAALILASWPVLLQEIFTAGRSTNISAHVQFSSSKNIERPADNEGVVLSMIITENMANARIAVVILGGSLLSKMTEQRLYFLTNGRRLDFGAGRHCGSGIIGYRF
jgi:hypothetical protein